MINIYTAIKISHSLRTFNSEIVGRTSSGTANETSEPSSEMSFFREVRYDARSFEIALNWRFDNVSDTISNTGNEMGVPELEKVSSR